MIRVPAAGNVRLPRRRPRGTRAAGHAVPTRTTGLPAKPNWYPREGAADAEGGWVETAASPDLYGAEVRAAGPAGTEATLAGTAQRYPGLNMTPWQQALRGEA